MLCGETTGLDHFYRWCIVMSGDSLRTQPDGENVFERSAAEVVGGARSRGGESAGAGGAVRGEQPVCVEDFGPAEANGASRAGGTAAWAGEQSHGGRGRAVANLGAATTRLDAGGDPRAAVGNEGAAGQRGAGVAGAAADASAAQKKSLHAQEQDTPENQQRRAAWQEALNGIDPARLVFLDETGVTTEMTRRYGRAPSGERVREATPAGHWSTLTLLEHFQH